MRKLIYFTMLSLDGFIDGPDPNDNWVLMDEELHRYLNNLERGFGGYLYGRKMYELMQAYWPNVDAQSRPAYEVEYGQIWKDIPKIVFSHILEKVEGNARLVKGDAVEEVARLKAEPGKDLEVSGSILASTLMRAGLIDEFRIFIHPVILGAGTPMFAGLREVTKLKLAETHTFTSGVVHLGYQR